MFFTPAVSGRLHRGPPTYPNTRPNLRRKSTLQVIAPGSGCRRNSWRTMIENSSWRKCRRSEGFVVGVDTTGGGKENTVPFKTLPKTNSLPPENWPSQKDFIFQPSIFRGYVSFREGKIGSKKDESSPNLLLCLKITAYPYATDFRKSDVPC